MNIVAWLIVALNAAANAVGQVVLAPIGMMPGWLSATIVSVVTGALLLVSFKYTSDQRRIKAVRNDIQAQLLSLKLFKESARVALRAQGRILVGAAKLAALAIVPMLIMLVPVTLLLAQLALWYQFRPLQVGEEAVLTLRLNGRPDQPWPRVELEPTGAAATSVGPVHVLSKREVCWKIRAKEAGYHRLVLQVGQQRIDKQLAIGSGWMRISPQRPPWQWFDVLLNPGERPFGADSPVQSISLTYPSRSSWTSGTDSWVIYWLVLSMVAAFCLRPLLKVHV